MTVSNPIDMPWSPSTDQIFDPGNNIQYQWDGEKWVTYSTPGEAQNYWFKDNAGNFLRPIEFGEDVKLTDASQNVTVFLDASEGDLDINDIVSLTVSTTGLTVGSQKTGGTTVATITSAGMLTVENINMEAFPALP